jgi:hypothetical protein
MPRELKPCGTPAAYARHIQRGEPPCDQCKAAHADQRRAYAAEHREVVAEQSRQSYRRRVRGERAHLDPCGTIGAYARHLRRKEEVCKACRDAWRDYCREGRQRRAEQRAESAR